MVTAVGANCQVRLSREQTPFTLHRESATELPRTAAVPHQAVAFDPNRLLALCLGADDIQSVCAFPNNWR